MAKAIMALVSKYIYNNIFQYLEWAPIQLYITKRVIFIFTCQMLMTNDEGQVAYGGFVRHATWLY